MDSTLEYKTQCPACAKENKDNSRDNLSVYDDGHTHCFSCGYHTSATGTPPPRKNKPTVSDDSWQHKYRGNYTPLVDRRIRTETLEKFKVKVEAVNGEVIKHHYPYYNQQNEFVGIKTRVVKGKKFFGAGDTTGGNQLFGQQAFRDGGKMVVLVEGELDAMSVYEMNGGYPVVSVVNGAKAVPNVKANLQWLDSFETVFLCFDSDEAGRDAAKKIAPILGPNKCRIVQLLKHKDASEYLMAGDTKAFTDELWDSKYYTVSGVATVDDIRDALLDYQATELIPLPDTFGDLQHMTRGGLARGELTSIIAHTSIGKTTILNELIYHFATNTNEKIGCFMVEDNIDETVRKVVSVHKQHNLQLDNPKDLDVDDIMYNAKDIGFGSTIQLHNDGGGSIDIDEMFSKIRYFIKGLGCSVILVDPLHTAIKNLSNENIEDVMDRFIKLCKETKACVLLSTHTRKPDDGSHPHKISEYDVKGSGAIPQACHNNILFSRNKLAEDEYEKNSIRIRVPKLRRTGQTGEAGWTHFDSLTGRLEKGNNPEVGEDNDF